MRFKKALELLEHRSYMQRMAWVEDTAVVAVFSMAKTENGCSPDIASLSIYDTPSEKWIPWTPLLSDIVADDWIETNNFSPDGALKRRYSHTFEEALAMARRGGWVRRLASGPLFPVTLRDGELQGKDIHGAWTVQRLSLSDIKASDWGLTGDHP